MRFLSQLMGLIAILLLVMVAAKNSHVVVLQLFLGNTWSSPLIVFLALFFVAGVITGLALTISPFLSMRRRIASLKEELVAQQMAISIKEDEPTESIE